MSWFRRPPQAGYMPTAAERRLALRGLLEDVKGRPRDPDLPAALAITLCPNWPGPLGGMIELFRQALAGDSPAAIELLKALLKPGAGATAVRLLVEEELRRAPF